MSRSTQDLELELESVRRERDAALFSGQTLQNALAVAKDREAVMADILAAISRTPIELAEVLETIGNAARRLCDADTAYMFVVDIDNNAYMWNHTTGYRFEQGLALRESFLNFVISVNRETRTFCGNIAEWPATDPEGLRYAQLEGLTAWSQVNVPMTSSMFRGGALIVRRNTPRPFATEQIELLAQFATHAILAIRNAQLFATLQSSHREISENFEVQNVMAEVLRIVASTPDDLEATLPKIGEAARRLCKCDYAAVVRIDGENVRGWNSNIGFIDISKPELLSSQTVVSAAILDNRLVEHGRAVEGWETMYPGTARLLRKNGMTFASGMTAPVRNRQGPVGAIVVSRANPDAFTARDRVVLQNLADQAVIAIQNAQLFGALEARNKEITEALRREEAGSEILRQISMAPEHLDATLQAVTDAARDLTGTSANLSLLDGEFRIIRGHAKVDLVPTLEVGSRFPLTRAFRDATRTRQPVTWSRAETSVNEEWWRARGLSAVAIVPIFHSDVVLGFLGLASVTVEAIPPSAITLLQSFADQAAIAIENARLIRELRESNRTISENLDTRRVMGEVLSIVASAPTDLNKTMPKIAEAAMTLSQAHSAGISWVEDDQAFIFVMSAEGAVLTDGIQSLPEGPTVGIGTEARLEGRAVEYKGSIDDYLQKWPFYTRIVKQLELTEISSVAMPMFGPHGAIGAIVINRKEATDFSERAKSLLGALATQAVVAVENARLFKQLRLKTEELEVASRHKSEFLANMSHELRTPLNAIIGYSELLQEECEDLGQQDFLPDLGKIQTAGKHLLTLISGILDLSKVEAGRMTMFLEDFDISTLVRDADAIVRPLVEKNRNTFVIDCPNDIGMMYADLVKVRQVLFNLLSNSAKFTEAGNITLSVRKHVAEATATFAIQDTGIGMTEAQLGRLFEAFSQASAETSRKYGGTGLGLALSREFCRMMGGDIAVTSEAGAGSTFTVTLPVQCIDTEVAA